MLHKYTNIYIYIYIIYIYMEYIWNICSYISVT